MVFDVTWLVGVVMSMIVIVRIGFVVGMRMIVRMGVIMIMAVTVVIVVVVSVRPCGAWHQSRRALARRREHQRLHNYWYGVHLFQDLSQVDVVEIPQRDLVD